MTPGASVRRCATLALGVCVATLAVLVAGCGDNPTQPSGEAYRPQSSPSATFANLRHAYNAHDADALAHYPALFDSTVFRRYFSGSHPAGHVAESWGYADEIRSFETFVQDPTLVSYTMLWTDSATACVTPSDSLADPPGTMHYTFTQVTVDIDHASSGTTLSGSYEIDVAPVDTVAGVPQWRIVRWRDTTLGASFARPLTTPYAPLYNLARCYEAGGQAAVDAYATLFDPARYEFVWDDPTEPGLDNRYGYSDEVRTSAIFTDAAVYARYLTFLANAPDSVGTPSISVGDPPGTLRFTITGVSLTLDRPPTQYVTNGDAEFCVAPVDTLCGVPQWKIIRWIDRTMPPGFAPRLDSGDGHTPVEPTTWGWIKNAYR
jgi:hypothetical protein